MELMIGGTCLYWMDVYVWILLASKKEAIIMLSVMKEYKVNDSWV